MRILTGNDLKSGLVIWWTGQDWSIHVEDAVDVGDQGDAIAVLQEVIGRRRLAVDAEPLAAAGENPVSEGGRGLEGAQERRRVRVGNGDVVGGTSTHGDALPV
jgi:hypothetical protein